MTVQRTLNQGGFGGNYSTWYLMDLLINSCSWTVSMSGSGGGGAYSATSSVFGNASNPVRGADAAASTHWGHENCWMVLETPDEARQIVLKRGSTSGNNGDDDWAVGYSKDALFTGGNASTAATASDVQWLFGTAGTPSPLFNAGANSTLLQILAQDAPSDAGEYGFILCEYEATNSLQACIVMDPIVLAADGDTHPVVLFAGTATADDLLGKQMYSTSGSDPGTWVDDGGGSEQWSVVFYCWTGHGDPSDATQCFPDNAGVSKYDSYERGAPIQLKAENVGGFLGFSYWLYWAAVDRGYPNTSSGLTEVYTEDMLIAQWDGATTPNTI